MCNNNHQRCVNAADVGSQANEYKIQKVPFWHRKTKKRTTEKEHNECVLNNEQKRTQLNIVKILVCLWIKQKTQKKGLLLTETKNYTRKRIEKKLLKWVLKTKTFLLQQQQRLYHYFGYKNQRKKIVYKNPGLISVEDLSSLARYSFVYCFGFLKRLKQSCWNQRKKYNKNNGIHRRKHYENMQNCC